MENEYQAGLERGRERNGGKNREGEGKGGGGSGSGQRFRNCVAQRNEIFLIFRSKNSNLVTWMSPKARNEPGWRIARDCVRLILFYRNI